MPGVPMSRILHDINRYKDDAYDRLWGRYDFGGMVPLDTKVEVKVEDSLYELPSEVLQNAMQPTNRSNFLSINERSNDIFTQYYMFLHFAEIQKLPYGHKRFINVTFNDEISSSRELALEYLKPITLSSNKMTNGIGFTVRATPNSGAPPIINGFEVYQFLPQKYIPTVAQDINAIMEIKHIYGISMISWQGDPCAPFDFAWDGLNCSSGNTTIRIVSLNLSSMKLTGRIATSFGRLEKLESLDLSNNELTGPLPEFLATLPNVKLINVSGNKLTGSIPKALREKANLQLSVANNPGLCLTNSCKQHKFAIPLVASVSALLIIVIVFSLVFWRIIRKKTVLSSESPKMDVLKEKSQAFSYLEVIRITNNFEIAIGKGGFGEVYQGTLEDDTKVAVKLLSQSSRQGYKEFQSEAQLLTVIHHRNLVSLVGFCDENDVKALIYEYMDLGDLNGLLSEKNSNVLKWNERLRIAIDAAKGVEYLHNGCKTPIIHRDLKPSNILLNKSMIAKIADFGLSRAFTSEGDSHLSTRPAGTPGFIDPEFQRSGKLDKRSDMYSFGMILLQLITGHPPIRREHESICFIIDWIRSNVESGDIQSIVDQRLKCEFQVSSAWKAVETAMSCLALPSIQRPDISYVLNELKECLAMEIDHANSNGSQSHPINLSGQLDSVTSVLAR
ncbi:hypothetical protein QN277_024552 [Acacia crassicarpa]|uniref:non-specific serine/threonine protein kinase n=1 Tax=Acacia crassicarpa TaxID=499986 RepID=A0AAE1MJN9_9FABA|nr:hypothetical protein QN277_024552 [Acacia crassicarpa]